MDIKSTIRVTEDYLQEGVSFKDITTLLKNKKAYVKTLDMMEEALKDLDFVPFSSERKIYTEKVLEKLEEYFI